jgi:dienelactone hydrolase
VAGIAGLLWAAPSATAFDSAREQDNVAKSQERFEHDQASGNYQAQLAIQSLDATVSLVDFLAAHPGATPINVCADVAGPCAGDTRIYDWGGLNGVVRPIRYVNRNGATISGHLWGPLPAHRRSPRLPAVLLVNGDLAPEQVYWYAAEVLARHGYVVMTYDPQGHGHSDTVGAGVDAQRHVDVQQQAACDCVEVAANQDASEQAEDALDFLFSSRRRPYVPDRPFDESTPASQPTPGQAKQTQQAAAGDVDAGNPLRRLIDGGRVGIAGHSRGAFAASIVGSRDRRIEAIVAWDNLLGGANPDLTDRSVKPRVPALGMSADYYEAPEPYTEDPDPQAKNAGFRAYRRAGVDAMELIVRGGTHYEWSYVPDPAFPATLRGIDMATWYTEAWFDKYLKRDERADLRLLSNRWRHDHPGAKVDASGDGNLFSFYYRSVLSFHVGRPVTRAGERPHRVECGNLRRGCGALVPRFRDTYRARFSYLAAIRG